MRGLLLSFATLLLVCSPGSAQALKDPAEVMPANAIAYLEVRQPGALVKELVGLFENSALGNVPESLFKFLEELKVPPPPRGFRDLGATGLFLAPEIVREAGRLQGAAVAMTGLDARGQPEFVAVGLPGESTLPRLAFRTLLAMSPLQRLDPIEGVPVYQIGGVACAMTPDALVLGTPKLVKDVVARIKGKGDKNGLAGVAHFTEARKQAGDEPGVFAYIGINEALAATLEMPALGQAEKQLMEALFKTLTMKAFRFQAYSLSLDKGTLRLREVVQFDPKEKNALLELLPPEGVKRELFHFTPNDAVAALALANGDGAKRWTRVMELLDEIAKLVGQPQVPSEEIAKLFKAVEIDPAKDVLGRINAVAVALGDPLKSQQKPGAMPDIPAVLVIEATDEDAAKKLLDELLPHLYSLATHSKDAKPATKEIGGRTLQTLPLPGSMSLSYGREGRTVVVGVSTNAVAQTLSNGAKKLGLLADDKVAAALKDIQSPIFLGVGKPFSLMRGAAVTSVIVRGGAPQAAGPEALLKEFGRLVESEGLLLVSLSRQRERLVEEVTWSRLKPGVGQLVDLGLKFYLLGAPAEARPQPRQRPDN